jgi:peptide/nickel transport system substrate-binding protein
MPALHKLKHSTIAALVLLTACAPRHRRTPDDTMVVVVPALIRDIDPRYASSSHDPKISLLVAPGLTSLNQLSLEPTLDLAESIRQVGELVWEVRVRSDARFSTGAPVRAEDVAFTYESAMREDMKSFARKGFEERYKRFERVDERTLRIHLNKPVTTLMSDLAFGIISEQAAGSDARYEGGRVVGAGPYRARVFEPERVVLEINEHYFGDPPPSKRIEFRTVRDTGARTLMLIGGSADLTQNTIRIDLVGEVRKRGRVKIETGPSSILTYLMMHNEDEILSDVRVRRAIAYAVDRRRIIDAKFHGYAVEATGLLPPMHWAYERDVETYEHNLDEARRLLDEAGYPDPDGPGGEPRMSLTYKTSADQFRLALARLIAAQLAEVGIEVEVRSFEFHTFFADIKQGNYQIATMQTAAVTDPDWMFTYFHSSRIPSPQDPHSHNRWRYRNSRFDELTERGRVEMDRDARIKLYSEAQQILAQDLPVVPLWHEDNIAVMHVDVENYGLLPTANYSGRAVASKRPLP